MLKVLPKLALITPCYNEELVIKETINRLNNVLKRLIENKKIDKSSYMVFIDDGSIDKTWEIIEKYANTHSLRLKGLKLSKNRGHQNALIAGMKSVVDKCDCLISIDADLQQDENVIDDFIDKYIAKSDVILGIRNNRKTDNIFKKFTALAFYNLMSFMGVDIVKNHADYRLLSNRANKALLDHKESNLFLRGMISLIGFKVDYVYFDSKNRFAGESKYTLSKMLSLAWNGITSFSIKPLRLITIAGAIVFIFSFIMGGYALYISFLTDKSIPGWASTVLPIYFIGGVQVLSIGIVGEYIGKIYLEVKERPKFFIEKEINFDK